MCLNLVIQDIICNCCFGCRFYEWSLWFSLLSCENFAKPENISMYNMYMWVYFITNCIKIQLDFTLTLNIKTSTVELVPTLCCLKLRPILKLQWNSDDNNLTFSSKQPSYNALCILFKLLNTIQSYLYVCKDNRIFRYFSLTISEAMLPILFQTWKGMCIANKH